MCANAAQKDVGDDAFAHDLALALREVAPAPEADERASIADGRWDEGGEDEANADGQNTVKGKQPAPTLPAEVTIQFQKCSAEQGGSGGCKVLPEVESSDTNADLVALVP